MTPAPTIQGDDTRGAGPSSGQDSRNAPARGRAGSPSSPTRRFDSALWITAVGVFVLFLIPKLFQHAAAHTGDLDTGNYSNFAWAILHGEGFRGSVLGRHQLGEHFSPVMMLIAPLYLLWQSAYVLMTVQAAAVAGAIVFTLRFADRQLRDAAVDDPRLRFGASALLLVLFLTYPPLLATWKTQFQPIELGMPLVVLCVMLMHARRDRWLALATLFLLITRESSPLAVVGLAIYAAMALRRFRLAIVLLVVAGVWAAVTMGMIMPYFRAGAHWPHLSLIGPGARWNQKTVYLAVMLLGLGPLPFLGRPALIATAAALPGILLNLIVSRQTQITFVGHYDAQTAPFLMLAAVHGVTWLCAGAGAARPKRFARFAAASLGTAWGMFALADARTPFQMYRDWYPTPQRRAFVAETRSVARRFADAPALSAWAFMGPQVCHRPHYMAMRTGDSPRMWAEWTSSRLAPGTILMIPTEAYGGATPERAMLRASGRAELVYRGKLVEAWHWPVDAPQPGTAEARAYADAGLMNATTAPVKKPKAKPSRQ